MPDPAAIVRAGDVELDRLRMQVTVQGHRVDVTPTEFELLATLALQLGRWGSAFERSITHCGKMGVSLGGLPRVIAQ
jgi:DNA-binding response OmpR family regulator